jgi:LacI family transcriptional regulator
MVVRHNLAATSQAVAEHYIRQGLAHFAYVGSVPDSYWSTVRGEAFAKRGRQEGFTCFFYTSQDTEDWGLEQSAMRNWLVALPKPCGLFAAFDLRARQVLDTCQTAGIRVPEELSVIGVDNDETVCENTIPTLSSVQADLEGGGYMAADLLDGLMRGKKRKGVSLSYGLQRIVHDSRRSARARSIGSPCSR